MTDRAIEFFKNNIEHLDELRIEELYRLWRKYIPAVVGELTEALFEIELNPLLYLKSIPAKILTHVSENVVVPNLVIDSKTQLVDKHFNEAYCLRNVEFKSTIDVLPQGCFSGCNNLESINVDKVTTKIGDNAFMGCTGLGTVTFNSELRKIGVRAFCTTGISGNVEIPTCLVSPNAFSYCSNIQSVRSSGLLGSYAFSDCEQLTSVTITDSAYSSLQDNVFNNCSNLTEVTFEGKKSEFIQRVNPKWRGNAPISKVICSDGVIKMKVG